MEFMGQCTRRGERPHPDAETRGPEQPLHPAAHLARRPVKVAEQNDGIFTRRHRCDAGNPVTSVRPSRRQRPATPDLLFQREHLGELRVLNGTHEHASKNNLHPLIDATGIVLQVFKTLPMR